MSVRVSDDGSAIPEEEARILNGEQEVTPLDHGVGMGLWLTYLAVTLSQGTIALEANGPDGNTVRIGLSSAD